MNALNLKIISNGVEYSIDVLFHFDDDHFGKTSKYKIFQNKTVKTLGHGLDMGLLPHRGFYHNRFFGSPMPCRFLIWVPVIETEVQMGDL